GADPNALDKLGLNVVHHACKGGHLTALKTLRDTNVAWNQKGSCTIFDLHRTEVTPLHLAATLSDSHILEYMLDEGLISDIDAINSASETALFIACWSDEPQNVSTLLSRHANPNIRCDTGETPLAFAVGGGDEAIVAVFLQHGCNVAPQDGTGLSCEMLAWKHGHRIVAKMFREYTEMQGKFDCV
ncbi:MAG: hypothetical protein Q9181_008237, partial [Wetmoreana brouardii]